MHTNPAAPQAPAPWWKHGYVWLLIAGPASVVVAGFATLWIALAHPETVVDEDYYRRGVEINRTLDAARQAKALMPAMQGRNHAATPATGAH